MSVCGTWDRMRPTALADARTEGALRCRAWGAGTSDVDDGAANGERRTLETFVSLRSPGLREGGGAGACS